MSYLDDRLKQYHITEKENTMKEAAEDPGHFVDFRFFTEQPVKGKDDVLLDKYTDTATVLRELQSFTSGMLDREYIYTYQISGISSYKIKQIFSLSNVNDFCNMFVDQVRNHDFVYGGILYYTTEKTDKDGNTILTAQGAHNGDPVAEEGDNDNPEEYCKQVMKELYGY